MEIKNTLIIKDWLGTGRGDISFKVGGFALIERSSNSKKFYQLTVNRKPDQYSSRLGMMANLNKTNNTLSWGFLEITLIIEKHSDKDEFISRTVLVFFDGVAVSDKKAVGKIEEELTFVSNHKGETCFGTC